MMMKDGGPEGEGVRGGWVENEKQKFVEKCSEIRVDKLVDEKVFIGK